MFGWSEYLGHLTSSGTLANLEALWVAGQAAGTRPGMRILASEQAHYTHHRISAVLKLPFSQVPADHRGRMRMDRLEAELKKGDVAAVVCTLGTTAIGAVDPLPQILALRERYGFRVHVDAAYGGYFKLIPDALDEPARSAYAAIAQADSIVIDLYKHDSPYTYFTSKQLPPHANEPKSLAGGPVHLGEISLECSRAGAAAVALWATQQFLPLSPSGEFARGLAQGRAAALELDRRLRADARVQPLVAGHPELDIVVWKLQAESPDQSSQRARAIFDSCAAHDLHLALVQLPESWFAPADTGQNQVENTLVTCLRSVLMKPEHEAWLDRIWERYMAACAAPIGE